METKFQITFSDNFFLKCKLSIFSSLVCTTTHQSKWEILSRLDSYLPLYLLPFGWEGAVTILFEKIDLLSNAE